MSDQEFCAEISKKISALIALGLSVDIAKKSTGEKVAILARFGISNQDIADILGTTKGTVEVLKSRAGKRRKL